MIREKIIEMIKDELNVTEFEMDENLVETYEIDSISLLDFFMTIEDEFDIEFEDEELESLKSANDIIDLIKKKAD